MVPLISLILAGVRIGGVTHPAFQAIAHLFVGGLIVAGWHGWKRETVRDSFTIQAILLSITETVVAVSTRLQ
jgi:hypothetical protein